MDVSERETQREFVCVRLVYGAIRVGTKKNTVVVVTPPSL